MVHFCFAAWGEMGEKNASAMFLNREGEWKRNGSSFKINQILKREKKSLECQCRTKYGK